MFYLVKDYFSDGLMTKCLRCTQGDELIPTLEEPPGDRGQPARRYQAGQGWGAGFVIQVLPAHPQSEEKLLLAAGEREGPEERAGPGWPEDKVGEDRGVRCPLGLASSAA